MQFKTIIMHNDDVKEKNGNLNNSWIGWWTLIFKFFLTIVELCPRETCKKFNELLISKKPLVFTAVYPYG